MSSPGASIRDVAKREYKLSVPDELFLKLRKRFGEPSDKRRTQPLLRALHAIAETTTLTAADLALIEAEMERNRAANVRRAVAFAKRHGVKSRYL
jgi:hypothetical protein